MANTMEEFQDFDQYLRENPIFTEGVNYNNNNNAVTDSNYQSVNPSNLTMNTDFNQLNGFSAPQEVVPMAQQPAQIPQVETPQTQMANMGMVPCFHPMIGWFYPTSAPAGVPAPPMFAMGSMTPVSSMPTSAIPSGTSTPLPFAANPTPAAPARAQGKRKYGPSAYLDARAEGRTSVGSEEANYFASNASRRDGRGDTKPDSFDKAFGRTATRPSIVQACICEDHEAQRIKRPKNSFILYRLAKADEIRKSMGTNSNQDVSKQAGAKWAAEPQAVKDRFEALAQQEKERHARMYPDYKYKPGGHTRSKFGTENCRCGAYELNKARFEEKKRLKKGGKTHDTAAVATDSVEIEDDDGDDSTYRPSRSRPHALAPTAVMQPPPGLDIAALGLPAHQVAEASALYTNLKRKHNDLTVSTGGQLSTTTVAPPRKLRRTSRSTTGIVDYTEPADNDNELFGDINLDFDFNADDLFDFGAGSSTSPQGVGPSPKDLRKSRQNSRVKSVASVASSSSSGLFVSHEAPAKNTRSHSQASIHGSGSSPLSPVADEFEGEDDDVIVVAAPSKSRSTSQGSAGARRSTRAQAASRRSTRSSGKASR